MTEKDWLACADPTPMLEFLKGKASERKFRLFAVGCGRHVWHQLPDDRSRHAIEVAEWFADGLATEQELRTAADAAFNSADDNSTVGQGIYFAARTAYYAVNESAHEAAVSAGRTIFYAAVGAAGDPATNMPARTAASDAVGQHRKKLLNDIFGNPFRPVTLTPTCLTSPVIALADGIYADRAFDRMPILADALQDAGCDNEEFLTHCRHPGEHVRGCWALDLVLGKS